MIKHNLTVYAELSNGRPNYRFFKLVYTAALRLKHILPLNGHLTIELDGVEAGVAKYKNRTTFSGCLTLDGVRFSDVVYVVDTKGADVELVTFWCKSQKGDAAGSKGGAHPFAEAYLGYLSGKMLESQTFSPSVVVNEVADKYNADPRFNITSWIIQKAQALKEEPAISIEPIEEPSAEELPNEYIPELLLKNKWKSDVLKSGVYYTNYEVDACIKDLQWGRDERITCNLHWEDGKFLLIEDFGRFDRYADINGRRIVYQYLEKYAGTSSRARLILTVKGDTTQWTLASATMLKRLQIP
jgi:hypothetical protein